MRVGQIGTELAQQLLNLVAKHARSRASDGIYRLPGTHEAVVDGTRELVVEEQKLHDLIW